MPIAILQDPLALILSRSTSMTIYTPIQPTYLYIKQHSITGLKYFGKTTRKDPYTYNGSGTHWTRHIKIHGKEHVVTLWVSELYQDTSISDYALQFSIENDIVESKEWANLKPENGLDGAIKGIKHSAEAKANMSIAQTGKKRSAETKANMSKPRSAEHKANISAARTGITLSAETKAKMSKPRSAEARANMSIAQTGKKQSILICPHCNTIGGAHAMKRYHFDNCKLK